MVTQPEPITFYFDVRSPFSYLILADAFALPQRFQVALQVLPYRIALEENFGAPESRSPRELRKVKYTYMDVRRLAAKRGLTVKGTVRIFDPGLAHAAFLYARAEGRDQVFLAVLLPPFWKREVDIEDPGVVRSFLSQAGVSTDGFPRFVAEEADRELSAIAAEAEARGVFGVPTLVFRDELFWGTDRFALLLERLTDAGLARA